MRKIYVIFMEGSGKNFLVYVAFLLSYVWQNMENNKPIKQYKKIKTYFHLKGLLIVICSL